MKATVILAAVFVAVALANRSEGVLAPVIAQLEITQITPINTTQSRIWVRAAPQRDCDLDRVEWRVASSRQTILVDLSDVTNPDGHARAETTFGPLLLPLSPAQVRQDAVAILYHRCHPLWLTRSEATVSPP